MAPISPLRPSRCNPSVPRETSRFGDCDIRMPTGNNPPSPPVAYFGDYSRSIAALSAFPYAPYAGDYLLPPPTPQNPSQEGFDRQSLTERHENSIPTVSFASRYMYSHRNAIFTATHSVWLQVRSLIKVSMEVQSIVSRYYCDRFKYKAHSAAEHGDADRVMLLWAQIARAVNSHYVIIATGSSGAFSVVVTILQLQATTTNAYVMTLIISAIVFILHGVFCSVMYIAYKANLSGPGVAAVWSKASDKTAPLWQLLALPLVFVLWAAAFTCAAMLLLAFSNAGSTSAGGSPTSIGPTTPLPTSGGVSSAPSPPSLVSSLDLADRLSIPLRRGLLIIIIAYGLWRIIDARRKLEAMAATSAQPEAVPGAIEAPPAN